MQTDNKISIKLEDIAKQMQMSVSELRFWPHFEEVRNAVKDYNFGVLPKDKLVKKLEGISNSCEAEEQVHYAKGVKRFIYVINHPFYC